jgi:hypothetical protein
MYNFYEFLTEDDKSKRRWKNLKDNRMNLEPEEREKVLKAGAVWHHGPKGEPTTGVWKSKDKAGNTKYICNTHRACAIKDTLSAAITAFKFIKTTA